MTTHATALVLCPDCLGGCKRDGAYCPHCHDQGHLAINRAPDGGIPDGFVEWVPPLLSPDSHARTQ